MRQMPLLLLSALIFAGTASAAAVDFTPIIPATAIAMGIIIAFVSLMATSLSIPSLEAWVKTELRELIAGIILVAIVYGLFISSTGITKALTGKGDYFNASEAIINNIISNSSVGYDRAYMDLIKAATKTRVAASYAPYISIPIYTFAIIYSDSPLAGTSPLFSSLATATQGLTNNILLYEAVLLMLKLAQFAVPPVILPLGLSLRLVPFTRSLGNTIIALSLAVMVFLPLSIMLVDQMHKSIKYPNPALSSHDLRDLDFLGSVGGFMALAPAEFICGSAVLRTLLSLNELGFGLLVCVPLLLGVVTAGLFPGCFGVPEFGAGWTGWATGGLYPLIVSIVQIVYAALVGAATAGIYADLSSSGGGYPGTAFDVLYGFLTQVGNLVLMGYLDTALIAIVTVSGMRSISSVLGGEWYLAGIQRLI